MINSLKCLLKKRLNIVLLLILTLITLGIGIFSSLEIEIPEAKANLISPIFDSKNSLELAVFQENSLLSLSSPVNPEPETTQKIRVIITAYSSTIWETDDSPFITAAGTLVRDGVIANNYLPFGTKIRIPELYGDKIFVVEDRMSWRKGNYQFDIWFPDYWQALNFGAQRTYIEVLEG